MSEFDFVFPRIEWLPTKEQREIREQILNWLNDEFSPWTFNGSEPATQRLLEIIEAYKNRALDAEESE